MLRRTAPSRERGDARMGIALGLGLAAAVMTLLIAALHGGAG